MLLAVIINGYSDLSKELNKISLLKVLWNITFFSISGTIMIYLVTFIIFGYYGKIRYLEGFSVFVFSLNNIYLTDNISNDIYKVIFFP